MDTSSKKLSKRGNNYILFSSHFICNLVHRNMRNHDGKMLLGEKKVMIHLKFSMYDIAYALLSDCGLGLRYWGRDGGGREEARFVGGHVTEL